jgi:hypothetical protein
MAVGVHRLNDQFNGILSHHSVCTLNKFQVWTYVAVKAWHYFKKLMQGNPGIPGNLAFGSKWQ